MSEEQHAQPQLNLIELPPDFTGTIYGPVMYEYETLRPVRHGAEYVNGELVGLPVARIRRRWWCR